LKCYTRVEGKLPFLILPKKISNLENPKKVAVFTLAKNFPKVCNFWKVVLQFKTFYFENAKNTEGVLLKLILNFPKLKLMLKQLSFR
jgi:hypothetical protein